MAVRDVLVAKAGGGLPLPGSASDEIALMLDRVRPSVVQVHCGPRGAGTGVAWRADGCILTNWHVVAQSSGPFQVLLSDGRTLDAALLDAEPSLDLALLQVEARDLPVASIGDSTALRVGELVFALGHPWGQRWTATAGVVSGLGTMVSPDSRRKVRFIRSDVGLAPGNSGGPLLNARGEVVGINAMVFGGDMGISIPSQVAGEWAAEAGGRRIRLGVQVQPVELPANIRREGRAAGMMVIAVEPGGLADRANLMIGDVLLDVDGVRVESPPELLSALSRRRKGAGTLRIGWLRGGARREAEVPVARGEANS